MFVSVRVRVRPEHQRVRRSNVYLFLITLAHTLTHTNRLSPVAGGRVAGGAAS